MIRAVLAVVVAVALLATAAPALSDARVSTTHEEFDAMATEIARTAGELESGSTAIANRDLAARTTVRLSLPTGFGTAPVETAAIGCPSTVLTDQTESPPDCTSSIVYRIRDRDPTVRPIPGVDVRTSNGPVPIGESPVRLRFQYIRVDSAPVIEAKQAVSTRAET